MVPGASGSARGRRLLRLRPTDRLRKRFEFGRVRDEGRRVHTRSFVVVLRRSDAQGQRLGLTVSQKVGCAVRRNRVKRLVREVFRLHRELFPSSADIVVIAKTGCPAASFQDVHKELGQAAPAMRAALSGEKRAGPRRRPRSAEAETHAHDREVEAGRGSSEQTKARPAPNEPSKERHR